LEKNGVTINQPTSFTVDPSKAGNAPLDVIVQDVYGTKLPVELKSKDGITKATYTPTSGVPHTVEGGS